jgi:thiamine biosynthesis lipoprotein
MIRVEPVMGTVASIRISDPVVPLGVVEAVVAWLHEVDARFSPYLPNSEVSRLAAGRLAEVDAHPDVRTVMSIADRVAIESEYAFDARGWRTDGRLDPSGLVKGWALQVAAERLAAAGVERFAIGAGGDMVLRAGAGDPWRIGIRHPERVELVAAVLQIRDGSVATSAAYERGPHIRDPRTGRSVGEVRSVTVVGPDLTLADAYATAAFVQGPGGLAWIGGRRGYAGYVIGLDDRCQWTIGMDRYLSPMTECQEPVTA